MGGLILLLNKCNLIHIIHGTVKHCFGLSLLIVCSSVLPDCAIRVLSCKRDTNQCKGIKNVNQIVYYMDYVDLDQLFY